MSGSTASRPTGITILAVLAAIGGVLGLLGGVALLGLGGIAAGATGQAAYFGFAGLIGIMSIVIAIASIAFAYGAWTLQPWAWALGMVLALASIVWSVVLIIGGASIFSQAITIVVYGVIAYYLNTPTVKTAFGRA
jgi:hypothetical protein